MRVPYDAVLDGGDDRAQGDASRVLRVSGEIERGDIYRFDVALTQLVEAGGGVVDLSAVTYLPSAAVAPLAEALQRARRSGTALDVRAEQGSIADRVLHSVGITHEETDPRHGL